MSAVSNNPIELLIVDDHVSVLEAMRDLLELRGHRVAVASSGAEALRIVERRRPQLIILDIGLPDMSGYDLARAVRSRHAEADLTIVALSGFDAPAHNATITESGIDMYLTKPVPIRDLNDLIAIRFPGRQLCGARGA